MFQTYLLPVRTAVTVFPLLALPADPAGYCATQSYASSPQLRPFYFVDVLTTRATVSGTWMDPATWSTALNLLLLAPLGFFLRYLFEVRFLAATALGFGMSLFLELTQLTGAKLQIATRAFSGSRPPFGAVAGGV